MALVIRQTNGSVRLMASGIDPALQEGEEILREVPDSLADDFYNSGIKWGDVIAWAATKVGIDSCGNCKTRQFILNHIAENGVAETIRQIKETYSHGVA